MTHTATLTARDVRQMARIWPASRILYHLRSTRETLALPDMPARNGYMARTINRAMCWSHIGIFRAELLRRGLIGR